MRIRGLVLAAPVLLVACAEKSTPPATAPAPPAVTVQPSAPGGREPAPAPARPAAPPAVVSPPPAAPAPRPVTAAPEPSAAERQASIVYVGVQRANFRQGPDLKARILAVLTKGTKLTVLEKNAQWYRVRLDDGTEGWVAESVISTKPD